MIPRVAAIAAHAALIVALALPLAPDAWFVGDPGVKLIAAQSAIAHASHPLQTDLPGPNGLGAEIPQPFLLAHGDHAHAITSPLFPLLSAPFLALFGLRGLYVLPALGWVIAVPLTAALARRIGARGAPSLVMLGGIVASPLLFYALEFWEHAPAAAAIAGAACLVFDPHPKRGRLLIAGAIGGLAILLRPEAAWWVAALAIAAYQHHHDARLAGAFAAGAVVAMIPLGAFNLAHFGDIAGPHISGNVAALSPDWLAERLAFVRTWLVPTRRENQAALLVLVLSHLLARRERLRASGLALGLAAAVFLAVQSALGHEARENLWRVFPLALFAFVPAVGESTARTRLEFLVTMPLLGVALTAPNDGGGQWGPRYLLPAVPFFLILATDALAAIRGRWHAIGAAVTVIALVAGARVSRAAWRELDEAKRAYARIVHETVAERAGASYVVTDVWWLAQMHAAALDFRDVLFVDANRTAAMARLGGEDVLLVEASEARAPLDVWTGGTCYKARGAARPGADGRLTYTRLSCR